MGVLKLNGKEYGGGSGGSGSEDVELTIAEYLALPDTKLSDDKNYFIKDINNDNVLGYPPLIYSDDEREIGVWRDGKPLYQKTINCGTLPNSSNKTISTPSNLENLIDAFGFAYSLSDPTYQRLVPFSAGGTNDIRVDLSNSIITITTFSNWSGYTGYLTIQYTKTTDTPGSGIWNGQGCYAHHYSTSETVIGTWIDGKPLYEKSFPITTNLTFSANTWVDMGINQGDKYKIIDGKVIMDYQGQYSFQNLQFGWISNKLVGNSFRNFEIEANHGHVVLQYTKTTD